MTGRNHHSVGMGVTSEMATATPATTATGRPAPPPWRRSSRQRLQHRRVRQVAPDPAGGGDRLRAVHALADGRGLRHVLRLHGREMNHWYPQLYDGTTPVEPDRLPEDGYHLTEDLVDHAMDWVRTQQSLTPDKPFLTYLALGATHAPFHVAAEWIDRYAGAFDEGWDAMRERTLRGRRSSAWCRRTPSWPRGRPASRTGTSSTRRRSGWRRGSWRPTRASPSTPTTTSAGWWTRWRSSASSTTPWCSTCSATTAPRGRADRRARSASTWWVTASPTTPPHGRLPGPQSATRRRTRSTRSAGRWR